MAAGFDVFISYKKEERALADRVQAALDQAGYTAVSDIQIGVSEHFGDAIDQMIHTARLVVVLWTPAAATSKWVRAEANLAHDLGTYLGAMVEPAELMIPLRDVQYLDLGAEGLSEAGLDRLVAAVAEKLGAPTPVAEREDRAAALTDDLMVFEVVQRMNILPAYEDYLRRFPTGTFREVAEKKIRDLSSWRTRWAPYFPRIAVLSFLVAVAALGWRIYETTSGGAPGGPDPRLAQLEQQIADLEAEKSVLDGALTMATQRADVAEADAASLQDEVARLEPLAARAAEVQTENEDLIARQEALDLALATARADLDAQADAARVDAARIAALETTLQTLESENRRLASAGEAFYARIQELNDQVTALKANEDIGPDATGDPGAETQSPSFCTVSGERGVDILDTCVPLSTTVLSLRASESAPSWAPDGVFHIDGSALTDISKLRHLNNLTWLDLTRTQVSNISALGSLSALQDLSLSGTQVSDISALGQLSALQELFLSDTQVSNISALGSLSALQRLNLSETQVSNISALGSLSALQGLDLAGTQVSAFTALEALTNLQILWTPDDHGLVSQSEIQAYIAAQR